jgi:hypothetical protein
MQIGRRKLWGGRTAALAVAILFVGIFLYQQMARKNAVPDGLELVPRTVQLFAVASSLGPVLDSPLVEDVPRLVSQANASSMWSSEFMNQCGREEITTQRLAEATVAVDQPIVALFLDPYTVAFVVKVGDQQKFAQLVYGAFKTQRVELVAQPWMGTGDRPTNILVKDAYFNNLTVCSGGNETSYSAGSYTDPDDDIYVRWDRGYGSFYIECAGVVRWAWRTTCSCTVEGAPCDEEPWSRTSDIPMVEVGSRYDVGMQRGMRVTYAPLNTGLSAVVFRAAAPTLEPLVSMQAVLSAIEAPENVERFTDDHSFWPSLTALGDLSATGGMSRVLATVAGPNGGYPRSTLLNVAFNPQGTIAKALVPVAEPGSIFYRRLLDDKQASAPQVLVDSALGWGHLNDLALSSYVHFVRRYFPSSWQSFIGEVPTAVSALAMALKPDDGLHNLDVEFVTGSDGVPGLLVVGRFESPEKGEVADEYLTNVATELHVVFAQRDLRAALSKAAIVAKRCDGEALLAGLSDHRKSIFKHVLGEPEISCGASGPYFDDSRAIGFVASLEPVKDIEGAVYLSPPVGAEEVSILGEAVNGPIDKDGLNDGKYRTIAWRDGAHMLVADREKILLDAIADIPNARVWAGDKLQATLDLDQARNLAPFYPTEVADAMCPRLDEYWQYGYGAFDLSSRRDLGALLATIGVGYAFNPTLDEKYRCNGAH